MDSIGNFLRKLVDEKYAYLSKNFGELVTLTKTTRNELLKFNLGELQNDIWEFKSKYKIDLSSNRAVLESHTNGCKFQEEEY